MGRVGLAVALLFLTLEGVWCVPVTSVGVSPAAADTELDFDPDADLKAIQESRVFQTLSQLSANPVYSFDIVSITLYMLGMFIAIILLENVAVWHAKVRWTSTMKETRETSSSKADSLRWKARFSMEEDTQDTSKSFEELVEKPLELAPSHHASPFLLANSESPLAFAKRAVVAIERAAIANADRAVHTADEMRAEWEDHKQLEELDDQVEKMKTMEPPIDPLARRDYEMLKHSVEADKTQLAADAEAAKADTNDSEQWHDAYKLRFSELTDRLRTKLLQAVNQLPSDHTGQSSANPNLSDFALACADSTSQFSNSLADALAPTCEHVRAHKTTASTERDLEQLSDLLRVDGPDVLFGASQSESVAMVAAIVANVSPVITARATSRLAKQMCQRNPEHFTMSCAELGVASLTQQQDQLTWWLANEMQSVENWSARSAHSRLASELQALTRRTIEQLPRTGLDDATSVIGRALEAEQQLRKKLSGGLHVVTAEEIHDRLVKAAES